MENSNAGSQSFHLASKYKVLIALVIILMIVIIVGIVLSALSIAAVALLAVAVVTVGTWLAFKVKSVTGPSRQKLDSRKSRNIDYRSFGEE